jgi:hypothetical protein
MRHVCYWGLLAGLCLAGRAAAQDYKLEATTELPADVPAAIAALLDPAGQKVIGPRRDLVQVWLVKELALQEGFAPSLAVKYPLTPGQLVGVISVPRRAGLSDFRGQELEDGVYTLRYGQQPMDGNHLGTSETSDFLLAVPAADDADPATIAPEALFEKSEGASGTTHPAIFSLLPAGDTEIAAAELVHEESNDWWILQLPAAGAGGVKVPLRVVVVGESKG